MDILKIQAGEIIGERYKLIEPLGEGGMGAVWRAEHMALRSPVALKLIHASLANTEDALARFMREAQAAAAMRGTYVVQILDYGVDRGVPYIAMEMLSGVSLRQRMDAEKPLAPFVIARIMTHVGRAMAKAHELGIVHRDLKPDNIFLVREDDEEVAKVLDFGIAKVTAPNGLRTGGQTRTGAILGTVYYMSPEQALGSKTVDWRSDLWAMAIITFEALTGVLPFTSEGLGELLVMIATGPIPIPSQVGVVPPAFDGWFAKATNRVPEERFQSAREQVDALRAALGDPEWLARGSMLDEHEAQAATAGTQMLGVPQAAPTGSNQYATGPSTAALTGPNQYATGPSTAALTGPNQYATAPTAVAPASQTYQLSTHGASAVVTGISEPKETNRGLLIGLSAGAVLLLGLGAVAAYALFMRSSATTATGVDVGVVASSSASAVDPLASAAADEPEPATSASAEAGASAEPPPLATGSATNPPQVVKAPPSKTASPAKTTAPPAKTTAPPAKTTAPPAKTGGGLFDDRKL